MVAQAGWIMIVSSGEEEQGGGGGEGGRLTNILDQLSCVNNYGTGALFT